MVKPLPLLAVILIALQIGPGGQATRKPASGSGQTPKGQSKESGAAGDEQARKAEQQRLENLVRVRGFADHIQGFKNLTAKVRGLVGMADVLWKEDEPYARKLFATAYEAAGSNTVADNSATDSGEDGDSSKPDFGWLRLEVVARIGRHDPEWARSLTVKEADASKTSEAYLRMASDLVLDDPKQAAQYLETGLDLGANQDLASLLDALRRNEPAAADKLFLKALKSLSGQPFVDPTQLLMAGCYIFVPNQDAMIVFVRGHLVFNFSEINPLASEIAIRAYLDTAVEVLSRPVLSTLPPSRAASQKESNYIAACLLLPGVRKLDPERAPQLEVAMGDLVVDKPSDLTEQAIRAKIDEASPASVNTLEDAQKELGGIRNDAQRDERCVALSYRFFLKDNFAAAKAIAGEVKDLQTRDKLQVLLGFEEGAKLLDRGKLNDAMAVATKLGPGIERAVLWLAIAHQQIERGDKKLARTTMTWALGEAGRLQDGRSAVLILRGAADLAGVDQVLAAQTMIEAVRTFNRVRPYSPLRMEWSEPAGPQLFYQRFPLQVAGLDFRLARMLGPLAKMDIEGTIYEVMSLEDEEARGQGLAVLASFVLEETPGQLSGRSDAKGPPAPQVAR